ncbi:3-deoxy-7-phosphoheptulonate synthase [Symbiobacterium terraclitae]|uniref:3-deoxy-7-phosphoheptulonate synthase n=1 Tax=Symbiobacterium terraclitae TaxID=557451 RepID=A0ABS4JS60_9FIRM|nr:bifunctional 3-deoxy-7-phosphoheptulonate synthase/chorismate mutase [Symbiobacterium terraclitae]MBP2018373.1 3-deoxy-7-phosphoheptulonate synthase [Symbiobacterium terraclitae]
MAEGLTAVTMRKVAGRFAGLGLGSGRPMIIAGPCSVEDEEQILAAARAVKAAGATALRGGAFKPRTSPRSFQGLGEEGLRLLALARQETGLPVVTEVMDTAQIDLVAEYADVLQVGSRNMQNFALLKQVGRAGKPVLLKRGLSATLEEWLSAAEYITDSGNDQVILCERGIRTFETCTRNTLDLSTAIVARQRSGLPVIVDPSHAAGRRDLIPALARAALAAGLDGLMIEVHPDPDRALSDAQQQLDFAAFRGLMGELGLLPADDLQSLAECREEIDRLDERILTLLLRRMETVRRVGQIKAAAGLPVLQEDREHALLERLIQRAGPAMRGEDVRAVWEAILACSRRLQEGL